MKFIVTGGRGFIGSHFVEHALQSGHSVIDIDKMTYASHENLPWDNHSEYTLIQKDIGELKRLPTCDILINFAAESHVDNSIRSSDVFIKSNILGVYNLLELVRGQPSYDRPLFVQISTDEVYGDILEGEFDETDVLRPSNPYSASKAAAEMLVLSYGRTYNLDYIITRSSNNYGERQYEEKLIPKCLSCVANNRKIPIHGDGTYIRDWLYVKDNVSGLFTILDKGPRNEIYNLAAENYITNLEIANTILSWFDCSEDMIKFVENRWGQDLRYAVSSSKLKKLGWEPQHKTGLYKWFK